MIAELKAATSRDDLAELLGYKPSSLTFILFKIPPANRYSVFDITKNGGGVRQISAPNERLKNLQRRLADVLSERRSEIETSEPKRPSLSHGFRKNHSIVTNARLHKNRRYVLNLDLENFFPTINFGRVRGFFLKNRSFTLNEKVATAIAQIACHNNSLPQGSPSSPIISDLVTHVLDIRLVQLAKTNKCTYSRYADDLTFSTNQRDFPTVLAEQNSNGWTLGAPLVATIKNANFSIKAAKTRMQLTDNRQVVTGLTVNKKVNIRANYYRAARAMCDSFFDSGFYHLPNDPAASAPISKFERIQGILSHIDYIKNLSDQRPPDQKRDAPSGHIKLYREFLFFKQFVKAERPLVVCEGKTDSIYLKAALQKISSPASELVDVHGKTRTLKVSFFKYSVLADRVLRLGGGAGGIKNFLTHYSLMMKRYNHRPLANPVILLIDNDSGAKDIFAYINKKTPKPTISLTSKTDYYRVDHNLYLVKTPELGANGISAIESFFPSATLALKLDGKSFNRAPKIDTSKEFGKAPFAEKIVIPNKSTIDFSQFKPLLDRIACVVKDYKPPS